jgi:hypothetical protein
LFFVQLLSQHHNELKVASHRQIYRAFEEVVTTLEGFDKGLPVKLGPENVENMNSLQVIEAERFLFSADGDFSLAEDMLRTNPELKVGPRAVIKVAK